MALAITSIGTGGFFAWFSYIAPLLTDVSRFAPGQIPMIMTVVGVGMTVGVLAGGRLADRFAPIRAIAILLTSMTALLLMNGLLAGSQPAMLVLAFATGANALALGPPIQMLLIDHSREAEMLGSSLGQSGFNIGNATGAFLGGIPLTLGYSYAAPQWVAAGLAFTGVVLSLMMLSAPPQAAGARA
jgi:DHA1 family arabinose polymer transporter-like MFS transporter